MSAADGSPTSSAERPPGRSLAPSPEDSDDGFEALADVLSARRRELGVDIVALRSVDSTNRLGKRLAATLEDSRRSVLVVAWRQTAGRGRVGRRWESPGGLGAYQSLVRAVETGPALGLLPLRVGLALRQALAPLAPEAALKWPNDLVTPRGKLGGILIERWTGATERVVIGYGINVGHRRDQLPLESATSIRMEGGAVPRLGDLVAELALALGRELADDEPAERTLERYRAAAAHRIGDPLTCTLGSRRYRGRFAGFDRHGRLLLDAEDGRHTLSAADAVESGPPADPAAR